MNAANIKEYPDTSLVDKDPSDLVGSKESIQQTLSLYLSADFFPNPILVDSPTREPKFENNIQENEILLRESLDELNLLFRQNFINLADYRKYYASIKDRFEINSFVCGQLENILSPNKFEEVLYTNQDKDQIVKRNIQKFDLLTTNLLEMLTLCFIDKKTHNEAQKILMRNLASSDKRKFNLDLN